MLVYEHLESKYPRTEPLPGPLGTQQPMSEISAGIFSGHWSHSQLYIAISGSSLAAQRIPS
jgi:hypothetical protein